MTIVLQNRFWDLTVDENRFSVGLSFNQVPSKLVIPYSAITRFQDPRFSSNWASTSPTIPRAIRSARLAENDEPVAKRSKTAATSSRWISSGRSKGHLAPPLQGRGWGGAFSIGPSPVEAPPTPALP